MRKIIMCTFCVLYFISISAQTESQKKIITANYDLIKSDTIIKYFQNEDIERTRRINNFLSQLTEDELSKLDLVALRDIDTDGVPVFYKSHNSGSATTIRVNNLRNGGSLGLNLDGINMTAGLWEAENGYPLDSHLDLVGKVSFIDGGSSSNFHATHVAGTIMSSGEGTGNLNKGIAYRASVLAANSANDYTEMANEAANGLLVSNHSYGYGATGLPIWYFGAYNNDAFNADLITNNYPYYVPVVSAGNDRNNNPAINPTKGGFDLLTGMSNSKNTITSAAVGQVTNYMFPTDVNMSTFSNWGPTDDGRIKPDISSKGVGVISTSNSSNTAYASSSGTSMSAPAITGLLLLLQQHYNNINSTFMLAATAKGLLLHTADEAYFYQGPDYRFGWGLANGEKAALTISNTNGDSFIQETTLLNSQTNTFNITANGNGSVMVSISWTDPQGTPVNGTVDDSTAKLVNDLDIKLSKDGIDYFPWKLNGADPNSAATRDSTNDVDNFEKVEIDGFAVTSGDVYTVTISHKNNLLNGAQNYSLIITGIVSSLLSVEDVELDKNEIVLYPNPVKEKVNFLSRTNTRFDNFIIVDNLGRVALEGDFIYEENTPTINVIGLSKGLYHVVIFTDRGKITKKLIKM